MKYENIFVLTTGRAGSKSFVKAASKLKNYTSGHESNSRELEIEDRLYYPIHHIEADNRLIWMLGSLNKRYDETKTLYVWLRRESALVVKSYSQRDKKAGILQGFYNGILMMTKYGVSLSLLPSSIKRRVAGTMVKVMEDNIELFLSTKPHTFEVNLNSLAEDFSSFVDEISGECDYTDWKTLFAKPLNTSNEY